MKLNLGSGKRSMSGYENIDAIKHTPNTIVGNILCLNYLDNSVERIFSEHVIEHLDKNELEKFFSECRRMLVVGGELDLIAPSFLTILNKFYTNEPFGGSDIDLITIKILDNNGYKNYNLVVIQ